MKSRKAGLSQNRPKSSKDSTYQPFPVTSPEFSEAWMDEVWTRSIGEAGERARLRRASSRAASESAPKSASPPAPAPVKPKPTKV